MSTALFTRKLALLAEQLWALMRDFGNLGRMDNVEKVDVKGQSVGMVRTLLTSDRLTH
ncbi:MAG: hypothetical protein ACR2PS_15745 [Pseudomonadales bacterium]